MTVYLIHISQPIGSDRHHASHYLGTSSSPARRLREHRRGGRNGAAILRAANGLGIAYSIVRTWDGGRDLEKRLKSWHKSRQLCPICRGEL